jgi:TolA-binding protein|tara:strand:+ start:278 stop:598 length:321 start_codon:yes stop_codon:yes gene_type:complete
MSEEHGWDQYSRLVLQQLETLSNGIEALRAELQDVKNQLTEIKAKEDRVQDLKDWKEKIDDIASPSQLQQALQEIEELKLFKTKAVTFFAVVQFLMVTALAFIKFL